MKKIYFLFSIIVLASFSVSHSAFGTEVGPDKTIGSSANSAKDQQLVYCSGEDKFLVIWTGNESGKDQIFYNYQTETDMAGVPITTGILLSSAIDATFRYAEKPKVSYDESSGKATVVWLESNQEGKDSVMMRIIDVANDNLETEMVVASGSTWNMSATVADDNNGGFIVAYYDTTGNDITVKYFDSDGISTRDSVILDTVDSGYLLPNSIDIAYNSQEENYLITWADISTNLFSITLDADGNKGTLNDYSALTDAANPANAYNDSSNQFFIVYDDFNGNVFGQLTDSVGNLEGVVLEFAVDTNPVKGGFPDVIFNPSNKSFAISWQDYLGGNGIWIQEYNIEPCNIVSDSVQISSSTTSNYPVLAYGAVDENYWIAWFGDVAGKDQIIAQRFKSDFTNVQAICKNIDVYLDANGEFLLHADSIDNGSGVPCGTFTLAISKENISCDDMPSTQVELVITNEYGETDTCEATVSVLDTFPPAAVCQDITVYLDGAGAATITAADIDGGSTDNCSLGTITASQTSFSCADIGDNTITLTVPDEGGNSSTCDAIVTVTDSTSPVAVCQNINIYLDGSGNASIVAADIDGGSSDNCGISGISASTTDFTCADVGANNVTLTVDDDNGNTSECVAIVTVNDTVSPVAVCQNITIYLDGSGNVSIVAADIDGGSVDNCGIITLSASETAFTCADLGSNNVTLTVTDRHSNSSTCITEVRVRDTISPIAICQDITVQLDADGNASILPADISNGSTDNCGIASLSISPSSFTCASIGTNAVTLTVTDIDGNQTSCTSNVTVEDNVAPIVICQDIILEIDETGTATIEPTDIDGGSFDNCSGVTLSVSQNEFTCNDINNPGTNRVVLYAEDASGNIDSCSSLVTVISVPNAICKDITAYLDENGEVTIEPEEIDDGSYDSCEPVELNIVGKSTFTCDDIGTNSVTLSAMNVRGAVSTCNSVVTVVDEIPPTIICQDPYILTLDDSGQADIAPKLSEIVTSVSDNCTVFGNTVNVGVTGPRIYTCNEAGDNTVTIFLNDEYGNQGSCTFTLKVVDSYGIAPTAVCKNIEVELDATGNASIDAAELDGGSTDDCGAVSFAASQTEFTCADIGPNTVILTVTDAGGLTSTCAATVTVIDPILLTAVCQNIDIYLDGSGNASIVAADIDGGSADNCGLVSLSASSTAFTCADIGPNNVTLTADDGNGNTDDCVAVVTVNDTISPLAVCQNISVSIDATGNASIIPTDVDGGSTDNCGIATLSVSPASFTAANVGPNNVTLTVSDASGNSSSCTAVVTVVDLIPPDVSCHQIDVVLYTTGKYKLTPIDYLALTAGTIDNVDDYSDLKITVSPSTFSCEDVGKVKVEIAVEDKAGNIEYCQTKVNVMDVAELKFRPVEDVFVELDSGVCETPITYPVIMSNACALITQTEGLGADGLFPVGTTVETWKASNSNGDSLLLSFNVVVTAVNTAPAIDAVAAVEADENSPIVNVPLSGISYGDDCIEQEVTITAFAQNTDLVSAIVVNYTSPETNGSLDISLVPDRTGKDTITVRVTDEEGAETSVSFELTINAVNKQPTIDEIADLELEEDSPGVSIPLSGISYGTDLEEQTITISATGTNPALVSNIQLNYSSPDSTGSMEVTIAPNGFGEANITVTVTDNLDAFVSESFVLKVIPVNDAPYLVMPLPDGSVNASYPYELNLTALMGIVFDDIDDEMLSFNVTEEETGELPVWAEIESGLLTAIPMIADTGTYSFVVSAADTSGATATDTFTLVVEGYPTAIGDFDQGNFDVTMYPNPSKGEVNLKINSSEIQDAEVVVRSITGSEVFRKVYIASEQIEIDLSDQVSGVYLITLKHGNHSIIKKLILDRK